MSEINRNTTAPGVNRWRPGSQTVGPGSTPGMTGGSTPPGNMRPDSMGPGTMNPGNMGPGNMSPGSMSPGNMGPGSMSPGSMSPGSMSPGNMGPGSMSPGGTIQIPGMNVNSATNLCAILRQRPHATAVVRGSAAYPDITGRIMFYQMRMGVLVAAEVFGLPAGSEACDAPVFGFHIHSGSTCSGNAEDPFADALEHYNPGQCMHPQHAGDLPPLFGNNGYAFQVFLTDRFTVREIIGKTVIIHSMPDDFRSQPGGNAGGRIACGQILGRETR